MARAALLLAFLAGVNAASWRAFRTGLPPAQALRLSPEDAVRTASLLSLGMRRLAADLAFVRFLIYYGTPENGPEDPFEPYRRFLSREHPHGAYEGGRYPEVGPMALRMLELDPRFSYAALYAAGALAFNLDRPDEALALLDSARRGEPRDWRYGAAIAAIGFHKKGDGASVLRELEPVLRDSECPPMIKNMAAFLCLRLGRRERAASLYGEMLSSKDPAYRETARKALERLGGHRKQHGT